MTPIPRGAVYVVASRPSSPRGNHLLAWCGDLPSVLEAMAFFEPVFGCEVTRLDDNRPIWPFRTKGGDA